MISSIIDAVLLTALAATSVCVLLMYRRLQRFDALQGEAAQAFASSARSLERAKAAFEALNDNGGEMAIFLASRLNEARTLINEIERGTDAATARATAAESAFNVEDAIGSLATRPAQSPRIRQREPGAPVENATRIETSSLAETGAHRSASVLRADAANRPSSGTLAMRERKPAMPMRPEFRRVASAEIRPG